MDMEIILKAIVQVTPQQLAGSLQLVESLIIENKSDQDLPEGSLHLAMDPGLFQAVDMAVPVIPAGRSLDFGEIHLTYEDDVIRSIGQVMTGTITASYQGKMSQAHLRLYPLDVWPGLSQGMESLAAYVDPGNWQESPKVSDLSQGVGLAGKAFDEIKSLGLKEATLSAGAFEGPVPLRNLDQLMASGHASQLEMAVLYAARCESLGLAPIISLAGPSVYAGVWLEAADFSDLLAYDAQSLTKRAAQGIHQLVMIPAASLFGLEGFKEASERALAELSREAGEVLSLDLGRARRLGLWPYSALQARPLEQETSEIPRFEKSDRLEKKSAQKDRYDGWETHLLDLSLRNPLISMGPANQGLTLVCQDLPALAEDLEESFEIHPSQDALSKELVAQDQAQGRLYANVDQADFQARCEKLKKSQARDLQETGSANLYLALGQLKWYSKNDPAKERRAPLILVPVDFQYQSGKILATMTLGQGEPHFNATLALYLRNEYGLDLSSLDSLPTKGDRVDLPAVFNHLRLAIMKLEKWDVLEEAHLDRFSFAKYLMWQDMVKNREELSKSPWVSALMTGEPPHGAEASDLFFDDHPARDDLIFPLPADASQSQAVAAAQRGESFVLHGPPGTGKSQTITNIIANALMKDKRVLFIAQKQAALDVVKKRLDEIGLGAFCLELHSAKARKKHVLSQLDSVIKLKRIPKVPDFTRLRQTSKGLRDSLNQVEKRLHDDSQGPSVYQLICRFEKWQDFPKVLTEVTGGNLNQADQEKALLVRLAALGAKAGGPYRHSLACVGPANYGPTLKADLEEVLDVDFDALKSLWEGLGQPRQTYQEILSYLQAAQAISRLTRLSQVKSSQEAAELMAMLQEEKELSQKVDLRQEAVLGKYSQDLLNLDAKALEDSYYEFENRSAFAKLMRRNPAEKEIRRHLRQGDLDGAMVKRTLESLKQLTGDKRQLAGLREDLKAWIKPSTKAEELEAALADLPDLSPETWQEILDQNPLVLGDFMEVFQSEEAKLERFFSRTAFRQEVFLETALAYEDNYFAALEKEVAKILDHRQQLRDWLIYQAALEEAAGEGLAEFASYYHRGHCNEAELPMVYEKSLVRRDLIRALEADELLMKSSGQELEQKRLTYAEVTRQEALAHRQMVYYHRAAKAPDLVRNPETARQLTLLQRALRSRKGSLRRLFQDTDSLLRELAPCLLMSPLSVAQFLPAKADLFDLVLFDEASQIPTAQAIGALGRASQAIVVGDPKQLPPTIFFQAQKIDLGQDLEDLDNILEDVLALGVPERSLLWHYRSRHESLIAFSNRHFYDGKLYTYPSPRDQASQVSLTICRGAYERGGRRINPQEAEALIRDLAERIKKDATKSYGVIAFSKAMEDFLEASWQKQLAQEPDLHQALASLPEEIFFKNLENVQGDERDVILFAVGYGPDEGGKLSLNFGPLNQEMGWRRLNVAISRARQEMSIFSSLDPDDFNLPPTAPRGLKELKAFLAFAKLNRLSLDRQERMDLNPDELAYVISDRLSEEGYTTMTFVGSSRFKLDLAVVDPDQPDRYLLGIQTGGPSQRAAGSAYDRDVLQPQVLKGLGWQILRVHPMDWLEDADQVMASILEKLKDPKLPEVLEAGSGPAYVKLPYDKYQGPVSPIKPEDFFLMTHAGRIGLDLEKIIAKEAPIPLSLLAKRVRSLYEIPRVTSRLEKHLAGILSQMKAAASQTGEEILYWGDLSQDYRAYRATLADDEDRSLTDVSGVELENVVLAMADQLDEEALIKAALTALGYPNLTRDREALLKAVINHLVATGRLTKTGSKYGLGM